MFGMLFGGLEILFLLFLIPLSMLTFAFWVWMLVDAAQNRGLDQNEKIVWILVVALLHFLGALIYFFAGRPKRKLAPA
jgi:hypothetical protein